MSKPKNMTPEQETIWKDKFAMILRKYATVNSEKIAERKREYRAKNKDKIAEQKRKYYAANRDRQSEYVLNRRKSDFLFRLKCQVSIRILKAFKRGGLTKTTRTTEILGCSIADLRTHIEAQFTNGMNWGNRNLWHIDHIMPLASATTEAEIIALCKYTNLQPLWAADNLSKGDKLQCGNLGRNMKKISVARNHLQ